MPDELTTNGLSIMTYEERFAEIEAELRANVSETLDLGTDTQIGQITKIFTERMQSLAELLQVVHSSFDPKQASGFSLTAVSEITGTYRKGERYSKVSIDSGEVYLDPLATLAQGSVAHVSGSPSIRFLTDVAVTNTNPGSSEWVPCAFTAENPGPVQALSNTLTVIAESQPGWTMVRNQSDATEGYYEESDLALRDRREKELITGANSTGAIKSYLTQEDEDYDWIGMTSALVLENYTDAVNAEGMPPHSILCIVLSPGGVTDQQIAEAVYRSKQSGIQAYGDTTADVVDDDGNTIVVGFKHVTSVDVYASMTILINVDTYGGDSLVKSTIVSWANSNLDVGETVYQSQMIKEIISEVPGIVNISDFALGTLPSPSVEEPLVLTFEEIANIETGFITITQET
jgi:uncharacterized phage protein gp47/JayE